MMRFSTLLRNPAEWMRGGGARPQIVLSSRIRLARNLSQLPFPTRASAFDRSVVREEVSAALRDLPEMEDCFCKELEGLGEIERQLLVERHLISREHAGSRGHSGVVINREQTLSIMINEEDHLRMQAIMPGFDLRGAHDLIDNLDTSLEGLVDFAFDERLGYLTSCPSNVGTGMRASAMLHLPGLVLGEQMGMVVNAVNKIGLAVRGLFGEGSEAQSNLFQISNQTTLGESETDILERLERVITQVIQNEIQAREKLLAEKPDYLHDQVGRSYGLLRHARIMNTREALNHLSMLRLGMDFGWLPGMKRKTDTLDLLLLDIQPAHLQYKAGAPADPVVRDLRRAELLRKRLQSLPEPDMQEKGNDPASGTTTTDE